MSVLSEIWRERYFWNGKLMKSGICRCYCRRCGLRVISYNQWTPEFSICIPCHIKSKKSANNSQKERAS